MTIPKIALNLAIVIFIGAIFAFTPGVQGAVPEAIFLSWQHDPSTTMTITWRTESQQTSALVEYGEHSWLESETPGITVQAIEPGKWYHTVELVNLKPATRYYYRVQGTSGEWTPSYSFRTAPTTTADFHFAVFGDNGTQYDGTIASQTIKQKIAEATPDFVLTTGNLSYADGDTCLDRTPCVARSWEKWLTEVTQFSKERPLLPVLGNRENLSEVRFDWGEYFFTRSFSLPAQNGEGTYSFDYGNAHIIALNSNDLESLRGGWQYRWLVDDLTRTQKTWKIVYLHHPVYSSGVAMGVGVFQQWLGPVFDQFDVDLVLAGHNHGYERTFPLRTGTATHADAPLVASIDRASYVNPQATVYVVTGGGGIALDEFTDAQPSWSAVRRADYEFVDVDISDTTMTVKSLKTDGGELDSFVISKPRLGEPVAGPAPEPLPTPVVSRGAAAHWPIRGFTMPAWSASDYAAPETQTALRALKDTGAGWVAVTPMLYQSRWDSNAVAPHTAKSSSEQVLRDVIRAAKAEGLKAAVKPQVAALDDSWSGFFNPQDPGRWLASYRSFVLAASELASREGADLFIIGTELRNLTTPAHTAFWRGLISEVRDRFRGEIAYDANWQGEYEHIEFWDALDLIGISANFPVATTLDASVEDMVSGWRGGVGSHWFRDLEMLHERTQKPIFFAEIGYQSRNGAALRPWGSSGAPDEEEQARAYQAAFQVWQDVPWLRGMLFWSWPIHPAQAGATDTSTSVRGKLAEQVIKRFWIR